MFGKIFINRGHLCKNHYDCLNRLDRKLRINFNMNSASVWAALLVVLSIYRSGRAAPSSAPSVKLASYHVVKKPIHIVSDKFLSFTVDLNTISHVADCSPTNATLNMAKSLAPAYFRLAGVDSNRFIFQSNLNANDTELTSTSKIFSISSNEWLKLNNFLSKTGMNVVACISGQTEATNKGWDLSNTLELITFSDKHNISLDWQLGYELQKFGSSQGKLMGRDVTTLRKILDVFPRYRKSLIIGPDMTSFKSQNDAMFVRNYLIEAANSLDVFTWHPFSKSIENNEILEMLANGMSSMDTYLWIKEGLIKSSTKGVVPKKSIWIAESKSTETVSNLTDSMTWILRMGAAAKLGASVYLRKPHLLSFYEPTPEYWTAIIYKSLVGRTVLDIKQISGNETNKVYMFTHCTKFIDKPDEGIINPEISYDPGSITVYGVNMASESMRISFKIGFKGDETAHIYVLTEDINGNFPKTLLNMQPLNLSSENELPLISPRIREAPKYLLIPGRSIFFVVFPNTKCRSCKEFDSLDSSKSEVKIFEEDQETNTFTSNVPEIMEDENDHDNIYVSYPKRIENFLQANTDSKPLFSDNLDQLNPQNNIKYVTFSDETWLNPFPEKFKNIVERGKDGMTDEKNPKKTNMYRTLAQAMLGKRSVQKTEKDVSKVENPASRFIFEDDPESNQFKKAVNKSPTRNRRSLESEPDPMNGSDLKNEFEKKLVRRENDELSLKSPLQPLSENKSESRDDSEESFDDDNEKDISKTVLQLLEENENLQSVALYLFNAENETHTFETTKNSLFPETYSKINAVLLTNDNLEEALNSTMFNHSVPLITFVQRSTFQNLIEAPDEKIKREIHQELSFENTTDPEMSGNLTSSYGNFTQSSYGETSSADELIINILDNASKLMQKLFSADSFSEKFYSNDVINKTRLNRLLAYAKLSGLATSNPSKEITKSENSATGFVSENDCHLDQFKEVLKNFDKFERSLESADDLSLTFDEDSEIAKPKETIEGSSIFKSEEDIDSSDIALYLFDQQDDEPRSFQTKKRSTLSKIYAVPLNEENLQITMQNPVFRETIPIVTFVKKPTLEGIIKAAKNRVKREGSTVPEVFINLTVSSTPSSSISSIKCDNKPAPQLSTSQIPPKNYKLVKDPPKKIVEEADKLTQKFSQIDTKNQPSITQSENLQQPSYLPELFKESEGFEVSRDLREIYGDSEFIDNEVSTRYIKTIDKPNMRPVSPFPKKTKNVKSNIAKGSKAKSIENFQLSHQNVSSTSIPSIELALSSKRSTHEAISSNQSKSADLVDTSASSDDSEEDQNDDSATVNKLQSEISKNLQEPSTHEIKQSTFENDYLKFEKSERSSPRENKSTTLQNEPTTNFLSRTVDSETVGKPKKNPTLVDLARRAHAKQAKPILQSKKPKMIPEQLRMSYDQKRRELLQNHMVRMNEIRSLLGISALSEPRLHKRDANLFEDWYKKSKDILVNWWHKIQNWSPKTSEIVKKIEEVTDLVTSRNKRHNNESITEQYSSSAEIFKNNRFRRNSNIAISPRLTRDTSATEQVEAYMAGKEEQHSKIRKFWEEKKAQAPTKNPHIIYQKDDQQTVEKAKELKEIKKKRINERRQNLANRIEEMKKKLSSQESKIVHKSKRDTKMVLNKIPELKKLESAQSDELCPIWSDFIEKIKQSIICHRNKRDIQTIRNKIQELQKKKQDSYHELQKKTEAKHSVEQTATLGPSELKIKPKNEHPVEKPATTTPIKLKTKSAETDELRHQVNKTLKRSHKPSLWKEKSNGVHKREVNENQLEKKLTSSSNLQNHLKFRLFADPELNTPQGMLENSKLDEMDRLERSISDNEIFEYDNEIEAKIKNTDHDNHKYSKLNLSNLPHEFSTHTPNLLIDMKTDETKIKSNASQDMPSQENQTCLITNYNVFKYLLCVAQKLWLNYISN